MGIIMTNAELEAQSMGVQITAKESTQSEEKPNEYDINLKKKSFGNRAIKNGGRKVEVGDDSTNNPPVVVEYDFFKSGLTKAFNRRYLFIAPGLFQKRKCDEQIKDEVYDRILELCHYFEGKNVLFRIRVSQKDISITRNLRVLQPAIHEFDRLASIFGLKHVFILGPLGMSMEIMSSVVP